MAGLSGAAHTRRSDTRAARPSAVGRGGVLSGAADYRLWLASTTNPTLPKPDLLQPRVAVLHIGTNDFTNCAWGAKNQRQKEAALNKELPGILGR